MLFLPSCPEINSTLGGILSLKRIVTIRTRSIVLFEVFPLYRVLGSVRTIIFELFIEPSFFIIIPYSWVSRNISRLCWSAQKKVLSNPLREVSDTFL
jgi:hypothetical protein